MSLPSEFYLSISEAGHESDYFPIGCYSDQILDLFPPGSLAHRFE